MGTLKASVMIKGGSSLIPRIIRRIHSIIEDGMELAGYSIAKGIRDAARQYLITGIEARGGKHSAPNGLYGAILVKKAAGASRKYSRWDVVVETNRAPYALWIEFGRNAPEGLPYSKTQTRDYSKSDFKGYHYLTQALKEYDGKKAIERAQSAIQVMLQSKGAFKGL